MSVVADLGGTPVKASAAAQNRYANELATAAILQQQHCSDMSGHFIGPIDPQGFLDMFMTPAVDPGPAPTLKIEAPKRNHSERRMYSSFYRAITESEVCPNTTFFIAADRHSVGNTKIRPDGGLKDRAPPPPNDSTSQLSRPQRTTTTRTGQLDDMVPTAQYNFHNDGLMVEFKKQASDPFYTVREMNRMDKPLLERTSGTARNTRGQLASYATETFAHQHRTYLFQLIVFGKYARFLYWDRSAAIVSARFDYINRQEYLAEFLWRYNHMMDAERGLDPTVSMTSPEEKEAFEDAVDTFLKALQERCPNHEHMADLLNTTKSTYPVRKITVADASGKPPLELIVQRPFHHPHSALGRATRTYLAYEPKEKNMYILKDTWRVVHKLLLAESEVYDKLRQAGVKNIPDIIRAGDVVVGIDVQKTKTQEWASKTEARAASQQLRTHHHHRIVQSFAYTADTVRSSHEWISVICDCIDTMEMAEECRVLHRDISLGNIMISRDGKGLLIDWDHAGELTRPEGYEHQKFRTGTWQFMSCALLSNLAKIHSIQDDLESIFWVTFFKGLHNFDHEGSFDMAAFEYRHIGTSHDTGGDLKRAALGEIRKRINFKSIPLQTLITTLSMKLHAFYSMLPFRDLYLSSGQEVPASIEATYTGLLADLSSPAWWKAQFITARDAVGGEVVDVVADKYPQKTKAAMTIALNTVRASGLDRISTCEIPQSIDNIERGSDPMKPKSQEQTAEERDGHDLTNDDNTSTESDESDETPGVAGGCEDFGLEDGDGGGDDLPPSKILQARSPPQSKLDLAPEEPSTDDEPGALPMNQPLVMPPPTSSRLAFPQSTHFSINGSASALSIPSSVGTKRSLSEISDGDDDVGASPRSKRAKPVARANLQLAVDVRDSLGKYRIARSPSRSGSL